MKSTFLFVSGVLLGSAAVHADWSSHMGNADRTGVSTEKVAPAATPAWIYDTGKKPSPGFYATLLPQTLGPQRIIAPAMTFDYAYGLAAAGGLLFVASSTECAIYALDVKTGEKRWSFFAGGAIRFAPVVDKGRVYFGSDDGYVYCVAARDGALRWKYSAAPEDRRIIANGKLASQWPVRTSVALASGEVYFSAGLFPADGGVLLLALKADTGAVIWKNYIATPSQGYILVKDGLLYVPNGRAAPTEFNQKTGKPLSPVSDLRREDGAAFTAYVDDLLVYGPSEFGIVRFRVSREAGISDYQRGSPQRAIQGKLTGLSGWRVAVQDGTTYFLRQNELVAYPQTDFKRILHESADQYVERVKKRSIVAKSSVQQATDMEAEQQLRACQKWKAPAKGGRAMVLTPGRIWIGTEGAVLGFDAGSGAQVARLPVEGTAWELAIANGALFVSTDAGKIYCFNAEKGAGRLIKAAGGNPFEAGALKAAEEIAARALELAGTRTGFCVVVGVGDGALAYALAQASAFKVICVEKDAATAKAAQEKLIQAGVYGDRVLVYAHPDGAWPYLQYFANVIVVQSAKGFAPASMFASVHPHGGVLLCGDADQKAFAGVKEAAFQRKGKWAVAVRGRIPGAGDWTHMFADPANTACSGDAQVGGTQYRIQWFGDPSPLREVGWHNNGMGPLYKDGRLFMIKVNHVEAVDAYNGVSLWSADVPGSTRFSPGREGSSACVDERQLYFAVQNQCDVFDVATGRKTMSFAGPQKYANDDWGFIAVQGDLLYGTKQAVGASFENIRSSYNIERLNRKSMWNNSEAEFAVSRVLFALDKTSGQTRWTYGDGKRVVVSATIALNADTIYLIESRATAVLADQDGSVGLREVMAAGQVYLVALNVKTGEKKWEKPFDANARSMLYLSCIGNLVVASYSYHVGPYEDKVITDVGQNIAKETGQSPAASLKKLKATLIRFGFLALDAGTGAQRWKTEYTSSAGLGAQHNYNNSHPVFTPKTMYHYPAEQYLVKLDMAAGTLQELKNIRRGKGCATPTASARAMFYRSTGIASFDFASEKQFYVSDVSRPSCWMNVLPAGGVLLMPEYSVGCNCAFPLQTSIVLAPGVYAHEPPPRATGSGSGRNND